MRILVTGVTGRIGSNLAAALTRDGHQVRGLVWPRDPRTDKLKALGLELIEGTITNPEDCKRAVDGVDAVYHLAAAFQGGGPFTVQEYFDINVRGTFNMLEAVRPNTDLKHFICASTDSVYAKSAFGGMKEPVREDVTPKSLTGWYGLSKGMAEETAIMYYRTYKVPTTVLRFPNTVGAGEFIKYGAFWFKNYKARPEAAGIKADDGSLVLLTDETGKPWKKHMGFVLDVVQGCVTALGKPAAFGEIFQLGAPKAFTWDEIIPHMSKRMGVPYVILALKGEPTSYEFDITKARTVIGFNPQYDAIRMIDTDVDFKNGRDVGVIPT